MRRRRVLRRGRCQVCGCTDNDCRRCIAKTGKPCQWANSQHTICTACVPGVRAVIADMQRRLFEGGAS